MSQLPSRVNLSAYAGDTWSQEFRFLRGGAPVDLTDAVVASQARGADEYRIDLIVQVEDAPDGRISLHLPPNVPPTNYVYDVEVTEDGTITTWVAGSLSVVRDVTNEQT